MPNDLRQRSASRPSATTSEITPSSSNPASSTPSTAPTNARSKIDKSGLYDLAQIKRLLDDEVIAFMEDKGYNEAVFVSNVKIICGTGATAAAVYSHFNPWEYPANRNLVLACITLYFLCIGAIHLSSYLWEKGAIFVGKLAPKAVRIGRSTLATRVWVFSKIGERGESAYKVEMRTKVRGGNGVNVGGAYEAWFTEEGRFLADKFRTELEGGLMSLEEDGKTKAT